MDNQIARPKFTKKEVDYGPSKNPAVHRCGICTFHLHVPGTDQLNCGTVQGTVESMYRCKMFDINLISAANDNVTLTTNPPKGK